jgi:hypothetical protein
MTVFSALALCMFSSLYLVLNALASATVSIVIWSRAQYVPETARTRKYAPVFEVGLESIMGGLGGRLVHLRRLAWGVRLL